MKDQEEDSSSTFINDKGIVDVGKNQTDLNNEKGQSRFMGFFRIGSKPLISKKHKSTNNIIESGEDSSESETPKLNQEESRALSDLARKEGGRSSQNGASQKSDNSFNSEPQVKASISSPKFAT